MPEPIVIMHFAREERIGLCTDGIIEHEIACTATNGYALDRALQQFVMLKGFDAKHLFYALKESQRVLGLWQIAQNATARANYALPCPIADAHRPCANELNVDEPQFLGNAEVDAILSTIQIRMSRVDAKVILYSQSDTTLHKVGITDLLQAMEQQRMMANDQVTAQVDGFEKDFLGDVQTQ